MPWPVVPQATDPTEGRGLRGALDSLLSALGLDRSRTPGHQTGAFTIAFIGLAAKMAKADGIAVTIEAAAFERCFTVHPDERENVRRLYDLAKADVGGYEHYAGKISRLLRDDPQLLRAVLECLFVIAAADGVMHGAEEHFLKNVAAIFGIHASEYAAIRRFFVRDAGDPYAVLGLPHDCDDASLRARYLALVKENHPDALAARGIPPEFHTVAQRKIAAINAAYDAVRFERAKRSPVS
jgi:DnaJ like chaperone protein